MDRIAFDAGHEVRPLINIHVQCKGIIGNIYVSFYAFEVNSFALVSSTETISDKSEANFAKIFQARYVFEQYQILRFVVYDNGNSIGEFQITMQELARSISEVHKFKLGDGSFSITAEDSISEPITLLPDGLKSISVDLSARKIKKFAVFSKNLICIEVSKPTKSGVYTTLYKSPVQKCGDMIHFDPIVFEMADVTPDQLLQFTLHYCGKKPKIIGLFASTLDNLLAGQEFELKNERSVLAIMRVNKKDEIRVKSNGGAFLQFLERGLQIKLVTAIDYTFSNGEPTNPKSLHFLSEKKNVYEQAIEAVGQIVCPYDADHCFTVLGFGGSLDKEGDDVSHCFTVGKEVKGLDGILESYHDSLKVADLLGPTHFAKIIKKAAKKSRKKYMSSGSYTILLILTDGCIDDMPETQAAISKASKDSPLSIIIIGVGNANFGKMNELDDGTSGRDIVHFVPFSQYEKDEKGLASAVLKEIPIQVEQFFARHPFYETGAPAVAF